MRTRIALLLWVLTTRFVFPGELHVAVNGSDKNDGGVKSPFRTISAAARAARPGDVITVHNGIYRERVSPPRGGESDGKRIVYQAAPGEKVEIRGSEVITNWMKIHDGLWKASIPNAFFGGFNPYSDIIHGDWFDPMGREHHTGAVYLNGARLNEAARLDEVLNRRGKISLWFGEVDTEKTTIWAQLRGGNPNEQLVEINVRQTVFYPDSPGINFITVRGFTMRHAATPWAPPTAEQIGLIGTHWSKGWIIENNVICHSICAGISLGKYGDRWDNTSANSAEGYVKTIERARERGWSAENVGHHIVRNNTISDCEQAGIVGSLGAVFSRITGNHIYNIWTRRLFGGAEMAGIKIHAAIDVLIGHNRIHDTGNGMWMDWMAQGTRITGNLCYNNTSDDILLEVNHGPFLVDNNLLLSGVSIIDRSEGGAFVHNLLAGETEIDPELNRSTPYLRPHSTELAGLSVTRGGDHRYFNNIFVRSAGPAVTFQRDSSNPRRSTGFGLRGYDSLEFPLQTGGNVYYNGALPYAREDIPLAMPAVDPAPTIIERTDGVFLDMALGEGLRNQVTAPVTSSRLGKARISALTFENPDGSPLRIDADYFGAMRDIAHPLPGPFADPGSGKRAIKVW